MADEKKEKGTDEEVAEDINKTLELIIGKSGVETAYFNSFLMQ